MFRFGSFLVKVAERQLLREGALLPLQPKTFDLLVYFLRNPGRLIRKEELLEQVWQDSHVEEANLAVHVSLLRKALGGAADEYILTVPKYGYRFVAEIEAEALPVEPPAPAPAALPPVAISPPRRPRTALFILLLGGVLGVSGLVLALSRQRLQVWNPIPITSTQELEMSPALSPDGTRILYSVRGTWHTSPTPVAAGLRLKQIGSDRSTVLTTSPDYNAAWAPDGQEIAFVRYMQKPDRMDESYLVTRSMKTGAERIITAVNYRGQLPGPGLTYTPDGKYILTSVGTGFFDANSPRHLVSVERSSGAVRILWDAPKGTLGDWNPVLNSEADRLAFTRCKTASACSLYEVKLSDSLSPIGEPQMVAEGVLADARAAYLADNSLVYPSGPLHARTLWRYGLDWLSKPFREQLSPAGEDAAQPCVVRAADGEERLVYVGNRVDSNIWAFDTASAANKETRNEPKRLIASTRIDQSPAISNDGAKIAFASTRSGMWEIWVCSMTGEDCRQVTRQGPAYSRNPTWSADGKYIAFESKAGEAPQIFLVEVATGRLEQITKGRGTAMYPAWSKDGKWLYYSSDQSGRSEVYRIPAPAFGQSSATPEQITPFGGTNPQLSPDGKTLFFTGLDLTGFRLTIGKPESIAVIQTMKPGNPFFIYPPTPGTGRWAYGLLFNGKSSFWGRMDWETQAVEQFWPARFDRNVSLSLGPGDKLLVWSQTDDSNSDLMTVDRLRY